MTTVKAMMTTTMVLVQLKSAESMKNSLSPTSRKPPENIKATKEIRKIKILLLDFQGFHGFYLASSLIIFKLQRVNLTPKGNF